MFMSHPRQKAPRGVLLRIKIWMDAEMNRLSSILSGLRPHEKCKRKSRASEKAGEHDSRTSIGQIANHKLEHPQHPIHKQGDRQPVENQGGKENLRVWQSSIQVWTSDNDLLVPKNETKWDPESS